MFHNILSASWEAIEEMVSMLVWWLICGAQGAPGDECLHYFPDSHFPLISWLLICDSADSENQNEKPWSRPWPGLGPTYSGRRVHWNMTTLRDSDTKHNEAILHSYILTFIVPPSLWWQSLVASRIIALNSLTSRDKAQIRNESGRNIVRLMQKPIS